MYKHSLPIIAVYFFHASLYNAHVNPFISKINRTCNVFFSSPIENCVLFSGLISRTVQDIDVLIDSLPSHQYTQERQMESLHQLETENKQSAEKLARAVEEGGGWSHDLVFN